MIIERADFIEEEHLEYLDDLQESGVTNMLCAASYVQNEFAILSKCESKEILKYWIESWTERYSDER